MLKCPNNRRLVLLLCALPHPSSRITLVLLCYSCVTVLLSCYYYAPNLTHYHPVLLLCYCATVLLLYYCVTVLLLCYHYALNLTHHHPAQRGDNCTFRNCYCSFHSTVLNTQLCASRIIVRIGGRARVVVLSHISLWSVATSTSTLRVAALTMRTLLIMTVYHSVVPPKDLT